MRVAWSVARQARKRGVRLKWSELRSWLARPEAQDQLRTGSAKSLSTAVESLALLLPGDEQQRSRDAEVVLMLVLAAFLRAQDPAAATAVAHDWEVEHLRAEGSATREAVATTARSILDRLSESEMFMEQVRKLHPWRRDRALELRGSWPLTEQVVQAVTSASDRGALLRQWAEVPPSWYADAPADVVCWLGELAVDYGRPTAAARYLAAGLDRGAFPAGYWQARRAMCLSEVDPPEAERILEAATAQHPLASCLLATHREEWQEAIRAISAWNVESPGDRALKLQLLTRLTVRVGDLNGGVTLALEAAEIEGASGSALLAAELLLSRGRYGQTVHRLADALQAGDLAIRARNARRTWQGDSVAAILVAVKAAALGGNHVEAWKLTQPLPDGDASDAEAADPRLRREAAQLAAWTGRFDQARAASEGLDDPFTEAEILALELAAQNNTSEAITAWETALSRANDDAEILIAARSLAELGASVPDLGGLERTHPDLVHEIRVIQQAMSADGGSMEALRTGAGKSPTLTIALAERHRDRDEPRLAAEVLKAGAERWTEPRMMLMAAREFRDAGDLEAARRTAESALTMGGPGWAGQFSARALLFEIHDESGDWEQATQQARALVTLDPYDSNARWALVHSLVRRNDLPAAWSALTPNGDPVPPRDRHDAMTSISLAARYDASPQFVPRALSTMGRWPDDEQLVGVFIAQLYAGLRRQELTPSTEDLAALHAATAGYTQRFPDSTVFKAVQIPKDRPLTALIPDLRARHEALEDIFAKVHNAELPVGLLAEATGASYAEVSLQRGAGFVRSHSPVHEAPCRAAVAVALDHPVVLDTTAAHTLALLDAGTRSRLLAVFGQVLAADPAYRDALHGHESLGLRSTTSITWDPAAGQPRVVTIEESEADGLADQAEQVCNILRDAVRRPWPQLKTLKEMPGQSDWLASLDMAATDGVPFWCDDTVLRTVAADLGVLTFGTVDLLRHLANQGRLQRDLLPVIEATLIYNYYADLGFSRAAFDLAATMDAWRPRGAAFAISRAAAWADPNDVLEFTFAAVQQRADIALDDVEGWISAAAVGLVRCAPNEAAASMNLRILLGLCLTKSWMRPDRLPVVLRGIRAAMKERSDTTDPVEPVLADTYRGLVAQHGHALATPLLMSLVQFASQADRFTAARVALTHQS
ncbi:hypothetical protein FHG89_18045 [Micromonospora orduensis]|uniref:PIN domain-containing protein n=1 Tax=Micromonospora orduensis TaxID=1420891 RepID=A0A5C4QK52_9ACTN|nr:hypothetical protein [Micromonospora orduensis]TNH27485.1 hypothetical protein FHG89_18045 [Micromonospora orduensis]